MRDIEIGEGNKKHDKECLKVTAQKYLENNVKQATHTKVKYIETELQRDTCTRKRYKRYQGTRKKRA